jgi:hypothetical protein
MARLMLVLVEDLDAFAPRRLLAVVDLAEIQQLALCRLAVGQPARFDDAPVAMRLPFFFRSWLRRNMMSKK